MTRFSIATLTIILLIGCADNKVTKGKFEISLYDSYNLVDLFPTIMKANELIRKKQLDSIANNSTGLSLLDKMNKANAKSNASKAKSIEDFPLFQFLSPRLNVGNDGIALPDTSAVIGLISDSSKLMDYLQLADSLFPQDLDWKVSGMIGDKVKNLHAIKQNSKRIILSESDIDSLIIRPMNFIGLGSAAERIADINDLSKYWIEIKIKKVLTDSLSNRTYTLILDTDSNVYSGSIVNFSNNPNQYIRIGVVDNKDFHSFKSKFESRMKIKK